MKRVLLTGASGFIGSNVLEYLLRHTDWDFVCLCSWRHFGKPANVPKDKRVTVMTHDLTGPVPTIGEFDFILHLASESHVDRSIDQPVEFVENNVSSTLQMLEYARRFPPTLFVLFSTDEVFGAREHEEWDVLLPSNPYSASKAAQEMLAIAYWKTYGVPVVITNSNNIIGPHQDVEKFVPKAISKIRAGEPVPIHVGVDGKPGKRHYNSVRNTANALLFILTRTKPAQYPDTDRPSRYSLGGGEELDNEEMVGRLVFLLQTPATLQIVHAETVRRGYDSFYPKTDGKLAELGWLPPYTLDEELRYLCQ